MSTDDTGAEAARGIADPGRSAARAGTEGTDGETGGTAAGVRVLPGAASRVADEIRRRILSGAVQPGVKLPEEDVRAELGVSRSTLREGLQLLVRERLVVHILSRGFFVRVLGRDDIADLITTREVVECGALAAAAEVSAADVRALRAAIDDGRSAAAHRRWQGVAAASIEFHRALVATAGSPRLDALIAQILAEFRLAYAHMDDPLDFHLLFLEKHQVMVDLLEEDARGAVVEYLRAYLGQSRTALLQRVPA